MLNVSAKEFVPAASMVASEMMALKSCIQAETDASRNGLVDEGSVCAGDGSVPTKLQLSPTAPAFVPRGGKASTDNRCLLDTASDPPRSVLTPPRSDTSGYSSIASPELDSWAEDREWYGEEQSVPYVGCDANAQGYYYYYPGQPEGEQYEDCGGYGDAAVMQGGERAPGESAAAGCVYDPYAFGVYDAYTMTYNDAAGVDALSNAVYYDAQYAYDGQQQSYIQGTYYWDDSAGTYVYNDVQCVGGEYGDGWQSLSSGLQPRSENMPAAQTLTGTWPDAGGVDNNIGDVDEELYLGGGDQLRSLEPSDAAELLEMFFPHYAGDALSRLLQRTGGDLVAAFSELAAMERQVGAERAAAAMGSGKGLHPRGGRGGKAQGPAGRGHSKRSGGGAGGAGHFKLDMESFPLLPPSPSPHRPAKDSSPSTLDYTDGKPTAVEAVAAVAESNSDADAAAATASSTSALHITTEAVAGGGVDVGISPFPKPNFVAVALRNTHTAPSRSSSSPAPRGSEAANGGCSSSATFRSGSGVISRAARDRARVAVPWVSTGEAVSELYAEERREAATFARARNQYFQQATMAYLSGNKALAKQLGRKGRELNEAMKVAHAAAAHRIFALRNGRAVVPGPGPAPNNTNSHPHKHHHGESRQQVHKQSQRYRQQQQQAGEGSSAPDSLFVDLHGLHAAEAVAVLESQIQEARTAGCRFLRVCTGTGHHTKGAKTPARLPAAVADALLSNHLTFKTLKPGLLEARL